MIPAFDSSTGFLPPGIYEASWQDFVDRFGYTEQRRNLLKGLFQAIQDLKSCGCKVIYADGGFIIDKVMPPKDIDVCWDARGVDLIKLKATHPIFWDSSLKRTWQKLRYGCEFFTAQTVEGGTGKTFLDFFQSSREGIPKGIVKISIEKL